jgi:hypothetical protein
MSFLSALGLVGGLAGSLIGNGKRARLPDFIPVDQSYEQSGAIKGNLLNFDSANQLANISTQADQSRLDQLIEQTIPGYRDIVSKISKLVSSGLSGEIPSDVAANIRRHSAERAISGGFSGSGFKENLTARDLGLTSYDITNRALQQSGDFLARTKAIGTTSPISVTSMFLTPSQRISTALSNAQSYYGAGVSSALANAAPDPTMSAFGNFLERAGGMAFSYGARGWGSGSSPANTSNTSSAFTAF